MKLTPDEQIDTIIRLMLSGEWKGRASHELLATEWGCHPRTVGDRAVAASAVVSRSGGPVQDLVRAKLAELEHQQKTAMAMKKAIVVKGELVFVDAPDVKAANKAVEMYMTCLGAFNHVRKTQEIPTEPASDRQLLEQLTEAIEEVRARLAEKGEGMH